MADDTVSRIKSNAARLLRDAKLLNDNERHASAFALGVLGLEEIGKSILRLWGLQQYSSGHLHKQLAVSCLLMIDAVIREAAPRGMIDPAVPPKPLSDVALGRIIKNAMESEAGHFHQSVDAKALDAIKRFAIYYDGALEDAGFHPDRFTSSDVEPVFKMCAGALGEIEHDQTMQIAKSLFLAKSKQRSRPAS